MAEWAIVESASRARLEAVEQASRLQAEAVLAVDHATDAVANCRQTRLRTIRLRYEVRRCRRDRLGAVLNMAMRAAGSASEAEPLHDAPSMIDALTKEVANLQQALATRDVIGQAKGILMERFRITPEVAFERLRAASQHANRKVRDLADDLVRTGEWPLA